MILHQTRTLEYATCKDIASHFSSRGVFSDGDSVAYRKCCKMGWLKDFFPSKIVRRGEVTMAMWLEAREHLRKQGKNRVSYILSYNSNLYNKARRNGWIEQLDFQDKYVSRKEAGLRRRIHTLDYATEVAKKYNTLYDFRKNNYPLYVWCSKEGLMDNFPWHVSQRTEYTEEMIRETVAK